MSLKTPSKADSKIEPLVLVDDSRKSQSPDTVSEASEEDVEEYRKRFVGEVDLPEGEQWLFHLRRDCACHVSRFVTGACHSFRFPDQEPLLIESKRRFVLFPIQYHEVSVHYLDLWT